MPKQTKGKGAEHYDKEGITGVEIYDVVQGTIDYYDGAENPNYAAARALQYGAAAMAVQAEMPVEDFATFAAETYLSVSAVLNEAKEDQTDE